ncbi:hypothetical protein QJQ45_021895 [Haematococcus lacustris]|nr:hypothetical protein QJQ45_021895 [Haematococcus lacustris]
MRIRPFARQRCILEPVRRLPSSLALAAPKDMADMAGLVSPMESNAVTSLEPRSKRMEQMPAQSIVASSHNPLPNKVPRMRHRHTLSWDSLGDLTKAPWGTGPWPATKKLFSHLALMLRLAVKLWSYLGVGYRWTMNLWRLIIYAMLLLPGFLQMIVFYFFSPRVIRNVAYGRGPRQMLDWYLPKQSTPGQQHPVVIFVTGGAWTIGYKAWGALLSERLSAAGVLVACLDYRNFPQVAAQVHVRGCTVARHALNALLSMRWAGCQQGNALDMLQDVNTGISWVCRRAALSTWALQLLQCGMHRGDPDNVVLVGQSAGGQLGALALMRQAEQMASGLSSEQAYPPWNPADVRAFISISGAYDMAGLAEHLHKRGLYRNLFDQIMSLGGTPSMDKLSPQCVASSWGKAAAPAVFMPPVMLVHGTADKSVPSTQAQALHTALVESGVDSTCRLVDHATHTVFLLEGPMRGGKDPLMALMLPVIYGLKASSEPGSDSPPPFPTTYRQLCPAVLCHLAGLVCPF